MSGYIGVNGIARKIKKVYVGVDGVAREVKSGYTGVGGVAKKWWGGIKELQQNWNIGASQESNQMDVIGYGGGKFIAAYNGKSQNFVLYSTDGISWSKSNTLNGYFNFQNICYGNGVFVLVGTSHYTYSSDGITWAEPISFSRRGNSYIAYGNEKFVLIHDDEGFYSTDGKTWTNITFPTTASAISFTDICFGKDKFIIIGYLTNSTSTGKILYSNDGISWTEMTLRTGEGKGKAIAYGNGIYVASPFMGQSGSSDVVIYSTDGISWNASTLPRVARWQDIAYGNGVFIAVSDYPSLSAYSFDGKNWTNLPIDTNTYWKQICYGIDRFVTLGRWVSSANYYKTAYLLWGGAQAGTTSFPKMNITSKIYDGIGIYADSADYEEEYVSSTGSVREPKKETFYYSLITPKLVTWEDGTTTNKTYRVTISVPALPPTPDKPTTSSYTVTEKVSGASYGFALNSSGYYESNNKGVNNSAAVCRVNLNLAAKSKITFTCINYAESNYDFGLLGNVDSALGTTYTVDSSVAKSFKGSSQSGTQTYTYSNVAAGEHFIDVKFRKDSSASSNNDSLQFKITIANA